mmetsp:Transcript_30672/g.64814  ORF Transcript_30672/g.64814 Transcript_30672/m.64814 type:complete len:202 (-) Transcript_30672:127-732(-)
MIHHTAIPPRNPMRSHALRVSLALITGTGSHARIGMMTEQAGIGTAGRMRSRLGKDAAIVAQDFAVELIERGGRARERRDERLIAIVGGGCVAGGIRGGSQEWGGPHWMRGIYSRGRRGHCVAYAMIVGRVRSGFCRSSGCGCMFRSSSGTCLVRFYWWRRHCYCGSLRCRRRRRSSRALIFLARPPLPAATAAAAINFQF